jgi:hypothetical protein
VTDDTSSANPRALAAYTEAGLRIDADLESSAIRLAAVLAEFAATCREYPLGIDASLADPLRAFARRTAQDDLWVRRVADQFVLADMAATLVADQVEPSVVDPTSDSNDPSTDQVAAVTVPPIPLDAATIEVALDRSQFERWMSPLDDIDLSAPPTNPWDVAWNGLKLVLKAIGDSPAQCNDAFMRVAQAVRDGPDAVRDALRNSNPGCTQSRTQVRLMGFLADGTPIDVQAEAPLNQFLQQMTAMADGLGGGELGGRRVNLSDTGETSVGGTAGSAGLPQGLTREQFALLSAKIRRAASQLGDDIVVQGSRAKGTAQPGSDIDIAIRVSPERFDQIIEEAFGTPNPGSALERTKLRAIESGLIQRGEIGLSRVGRELEGEIGIQPVQISVVRLGGLFDVGPFIPLGLTSP